MKNILITGAAGFVGCNFVRYMQNKYGKDIFIVSLDYLSYAGSLENLKDIPDPVGHEFIMGNTCDQKLVEWILRFYDIDTIVNFAAETHVDRSIVDPEKFIISNINCTFHLLEAARIAWKDTGYHGKRFNHISTDEVYGSLAPDDLPSTELTPCRSSSPYSASKAAADQLVISYYITYGLPVTISRCTNNYGPYQMPEKLIPRTIALLAQHEKITIHGDGQQIRDWIYVMDHCEAVDCILQNGRLGEIYNIGGNNQVTNLEVMRLICNYIGAFHVGNQGPLASNSISVPDRLGNDRRYCLNLRKIYNNLGWYPKTQFVLGLYNTIEWYILNSTWVGQMLKRLEEK